jgi:hypothetical protein
MLWMPLCRAAWTSYSSVIADCKLRAARGRCPSGRKGSSLLAVRGFKAGILRSHLPHGAHWIAQVAYANKRPFVGKHVGQGMSAWRPAASSVRNPQQSSLTPISSPNDGLAGGGAVPSLERDSDALWVWA